MKKSSLGFLFTILILPNTLSAQEIAQSFETPKPIEMETPRFPTSAAANGQEGWVTLNFMVDSTGDVFEPTVVGSAGPESLQRAAIRALERSEFEPAKLNGEPVEGSLFWTYRFVLEGAELTARTSIQRDYRRMLEYIESNDLDAADQLMASMIEEETKTNTEHALLNLASFAYSEKFNNDEIEQMEYLQNALMYESFDSGNTNGYLPEDLRNFARQRLFILQANNSRYGEALQTFDNMRDSDNAVEPFAEVVAQIMSLHRDNSMYVVKGTTDNNGFWTLQLLKPGVFIDNLGNRISEFRLRCRNKYQFFSFQEGAQYQIPESWGACTLEVLGDANIDFEVIQFRNAQ